MLPCRHASPPLPAPSLPPPPRMYTSSSIRRAPCGCPSIHRRGGLWQRRRGDGETSAEAAETAATSEAGVRAHPRRWRATRGGTDIHRAGGQTGGRGWRTEQAAPAAARATESNSSSSSSHPNPGPPPPQESLQTTLRASTPSPRLVLSSCPTPRWRPRKRHHAAPSAPSSPIRGAARTGRRDPAGTPRRRRWRRCHPTLPRLVGRPLCMTATYGGDPQRHGTAPTAPA